MSNFLIFKAAFNDSATPAIGTYTAEGADAYFNSNPDLSPDYYLYGKTSRSAIRWFVPTKETTDFEFVADILTTISSGYFTYFIIADSTGTTRLRMWSLNYLVYFENDDSTAQTGTQYIGRFRDTDIGGFNVFHQFRFRVRKLTASSSSVEVYVDGTLKLTATAGAALVTCAKIGFMGGVRDTEPLGTRTGIQNTYLYDLSDGDVVNPGVLSGAFNRFISWMKSKFALKSDIPTVNDATLTIQKNGTNVATFTANQSTNATANIQCVDLSTAQTVGGIKTFSNAPVVGSINLDGKTIDTDANGNMTYDSHIVDTIEEQGEGYIRYSNGIQICWGKISRTSSSKSWDIFYESSESFSENYPKSFISLPAVTTGSDGNDFCLIEAARGTTTQTPNMFAIRPSEFTDRTFTISYIAIGRWK